MSIRVLVADDHPFFRQGLRNLVDSNEELELVGEAADGREAVRLAQGSAPDVVLMDLQMPGLSGIEATRAVVAADPDVRVLVLTMYEDDDSVFAAMRAGARGYLLKGAGEEEVLRAVRAVASGDAIFGPTIAARLTAYFAEPTPKVFPQLTDRERDVLHLLAAGRSNDAIARELTLSLKTVRNHVSNLFNKLQVVDRGQAIVKAREAGMG